MINYALCWHLHRVIYGSLIELKRRLVAQQGIVQCISTRLEPEPKNKKREGKGKVIYACVYSPLKGTGCKRPVQNCSKCSQASRKHSCSVLVDLPVNRLDVCLVSTFNPRICAALCIAEVWVINSMWRQASRPCFWAWPSLTSLTAVFTDFSLYSLSWSDILITQWVKKKDAGVTPQKYHICTATQNSVLLGQYMPGSGIWGTFQLSASTKGEVLLPNILLWQHRQSFSLRRSSVNRKGRGTGSERVALYTCCARFVCRKYSCKLLWGMINERTKSSVDKYWGRQACFCEEL